MTKFLRTACIAAGALAASAGVALAQPVTEQNPFAGFYVGGMVGYDMFHIQNSSTIPSFDNNNGGRIAGLGRDGIAGGVVLGFNVPLGNAFILGVEGSGRYSDASGDTSLSDTNSSSTIHQGARESWGVVGRAGVLLSPRTMLYASAGWGQTRFNTSFINTPTGGSPTTVFNDGVTRNAWRIGGGVEAALGGGWTARLDYTYADYKNYNVVLNSTNSFLVKPVAHEVSLGVSHYF